MSERRSPCTVAWFRAEAFYCLLAMFCMVVTVEVTKNAHLI
jgi:hypothetical protein